MPLLGFHYAVVAGTVCSPATLRTIRGMPRLRFLLATSWPCDATAEVRVEQLHPEILEMTLSAEGLHGRYEDAYHPMRVPVAAEPPLAYELHPWCQPGVELVVCGPLSSERRGSMSFIEICAQEAWRL